MLGLRGQAKVGAWTRNTRKTGKSLNMGAPVKHKRIIAVGLLFVIQPSWSQPARPAEAPAFVNVVVSKQQEASSIASWVVNDSHARGVPLEPERIALHVPSLDIFSPDGALIYQAADVDDAVKVLAALPALPGPTPGTMTLDEALDTVPEFQHDKQAIKSKHQYIIYAITYNGGPCKRCALQDQAIDNLRKNSALNRFLILQVTLTK